MVYVIFDIDVTLTESNSWASLHNAAGINAEEDMLYFSQFINKKITYEEWLHILEQRYREEGLLTKSLAKEVLCNMTLKNDVANIINDLKTDNYSILLITGSFLDVARSIAQKTGVTDYLAVNDIEYDKFDLFKNFNTKGEEGEAKLKLLENFCKDRNLEISECICIGNGYNDIKLFDKTKKGITFEWCDLEVKKHARLVVKNLIDIPEAVRKLAHN